MSDELTTEAVADTEPKKSGSGFWRFLRDLLLIVLAALVISFVIKTFFIRSFYIPSGSMMNTLQVNDRVLVSLLTPGLTPLKRGDVIVFENPGGWLRDEGEHPTAKTPSSPITQVLAFIGLVPPDDDSHLIKRVIGLPGDVVKCCAPDGKITVNGVEVTEPFINKAKAGLPDDDFQYTVTVPKGDLWVLGDNRYDSKDSAWHETNKDATPFVPISDVTGRAVLITWPVSRWTSLGDYQDQFGKIPNP